MPKRSMSMTEKQPLIECIEEDAKEPSSLPVTWKSVLNCIYRRISLRRNQFIVVVLYAIFTMLIAGFYIVSFYLTGVTKSTHVDIVPVHRESNVLGMEGLLSKKYDTIRDIETKRITAVDSEMLPRPYI